MDISLTPELEHFLTETLKRGNYRSVSEIINRALALLKEEEDLQGVDLDELRAMVTAGLEEADRGDFEPWRANDIEEEGRRRLADKQKPR